MIKSIGPRDVELALILDLTTEAELVSDNVSIAVNAEVFQLALRPDLLVHSLRPRLVLVVVTYHFEL